MAEIAIHIAPSVGTASTCCDAKGARDYDVTLTIGETKLAVEVTLVPAQYDGRLGMWGDLDNWITDPGVKLIQALGAAGKVLAEEITAACSVGQASEIDVDLTEVERRAETSAEEEIDELAERGALPLSPSWDDAARNAGAARCDHIPACLEAAYYAAYTARGNARAAELDAEGAEAE